MPGISYLGNSQVKAEDCSDHHNVVRQVFGFLCFGVVIPSECTTGSIAHFAGSRR
jgi:hypothetical protein